MRGRASHRPQSVGRVSSQLGSSKPSHLVRSPWTTRKHARPMAKLTFIQTDGTQQVVDGEVGLTVMEVAKKNLVAGIEAECGGACACATCHVYVDDAWTEKVGKPQEMEEDMLDFAFDVRETSRLSCQVKVTEDLDGLVLHVPAKQF